MKDYSLNSIVRRLHAWRRPIVVTTAAVAILSAIVSLIVPVYYLATTTFYAASQDLFVPSKVLGYSDNDILYYGTTDDIQRVLTTATSHELTDYLISEFDLYDHYNIDSTQKKAKYKVRERLLDNYDIIRTKYDALELSVEDRDPEVAARMANAARKKINSLLSGIIKESQKQLITSYQSAINDKEKLVTSLYDSLNKYQIEYGIFDPEAQTEFLSTLVTEVETRLSGERARLKTYQSFSSYNRDSVNYLKSVIAGLEQQKKLLTHPDSNSNYSVHRFNTGKGKITVLDDAYRKAVNSLNIDKELLKQQQSANILDIPAIHVVEVAQVPVVKHRPKRTLLVLASTFAAFLFMIIGVLLIESYRHLDWSFLRKW